MAEKCTLIPEQLFESQDAFITHVKRFAMENGFNVRLDDVERDKDGEIRKRDIVCSAEGAPRGKDSKREGSVVEEAPKTVAHSGAHRRKSMKTGCRWLARASRQASGMWKIIMLRLEHNHQLARFEVPLPTYARSGDNQSISAAALAAKAALEGGAYHGPSVEFKNLFLQMSAACADLCWAAARHPETVAEVLGEIRRLNQHLDRDRNRSRSQSALPTIDEAEPVPERFEAESPAPRESPELSAVATAEALSPAAAPAGPIKRSRGRPRKNPLDKPKPKKKDSVQATPTPADLASLSHQIITQNTTRPIASLALPTRPALPSVRPQQQQQQQQQSP
ncbi:hypothetical protein GGI25_003610, partial [Coemansia spiralis]